MSIVNCPACRIRVMPKVQGDCPACGSLINAEGDRTPSTESTCDPLHPVVFDAGQESVRDLGEPSHERLWRHREMLVIARGAELPEVCLKSNAACDRMERVTLWHRTNHEWWMAFFPRLILANSVKVRLQVGLSPGWRFWRRSCLVIGWGSLFLFLGLFTATAIVANIIRPPLPDAIREMDPSLVGLAAGGIICVPLIVGALAMMAANILSIPRLTDRHIYVRGVHPGFLAELPTFVRE